MISNNEGLPRRTKHGSVATFIDGHRFASKAEAGRYGELKLMLAAGEITDLQIHPRYRLQGGFSHRGRRIRPIWYVADFAYLENGQLVVEEVKGHRTAVFNLKEKLFLKRYPDIDFRVIEV